MSNQIIKRSIPNEMLFDLLNEICVKNEKYYIFNNESFKRGIFKELIPNFIENCKPFYYLSKRKYLEKKLTYKSFITILRQICKHNNILYTSQIKYDKSTYNIIYNIYHIPCL
jgi:hypothetical protein